MNKSIIVIDDFYNDPEAIRNFALKQKFNKSTSTDGFNGDLSKISVASKNSLMRKISKVMNLNLSYEVKLQGDFKVLLKSQFKRKTTYVHYDPSEWSGVLCLSPSNIIRGSTSFWHHKELDLDGFHDQQKLALVCQKRKYNLKHILNIVDRDTSNLAKWRETNRIEHRYNRLILFRGYMFHAASEGFGNKIQNAKLTQTFFFFEKKRPSKNQVQGWNFVENK